MVEQEPGASLGAHRVGEGRSSGSRRKDEPRSVLAPRDGLDIDRRVSDPRGSAAVDRDTLSAPQTTVVETWDVQAGRGKVRLSHTFSNVQQGFYLRLRGSDGNQLDAAGNPVMDVAGNEDPFADLWFYANPVFVDVV